LAPELWNIHRTIKNENQASSANCFFNNAMRLTWHHQDVQGVFAVALRSASVHPEMVYFGSGHSRSDFVTAGVAGLHRGLQSARTPDRVERCRFWMDTI